MKIISILEACHAKLLKLLLTLENQIDHYHLFIRALFVGFSVWFISVFFYMQQYFSFEKLSASGRAVDFLKLCANPLARDLTEPILAYRITTPTLAWLLGLLSSFALILPSLFMIILLSTIYVICYLKIGKTIAILTTLGISFTQVVLWNNAHMGFPDAVTHLCAVLCLLFTNIFVISVLTLLGIMNDERFVLAIPFVLLWHCNISKNSIDVRLIRNVITGLLLGLFASFIFRHALTIGLIGSGIETPKVYEAIVFNLFNSLGFIFRHIFWFSVNYFMSFRFLWLIPIVCFIIASTRARWYFTLLWLLMFAVLFASSLVWDVSRSIAFSFPAILISIRYLYDFNSEYCRKLVMISVILCLVTPAFFLGPGGLQLYLPLPFVLLRECTGIDIVDFVRTSGHGTFGIH